MSNTESRIKLIFDGIADGVLAAAAEARAAMAGVDDATRKVSVSSGELEKASTALVKAQRDAAIASGALANARRSEENAAGALRVAELRLQDLRSKGNATATQLAAAEERVAAAKRRSETATTNVAAAERRAATAADRLTAAHEKLRLASEGAADSTNRFSFNLSKLLKDIDNANVHVLSLASAFRIVGFAALGIGAGGVLGQALAGALPLLVGLGAAAGTVFLGLDGIKKAAKGLQAPFNALKASVSTTFEKNLAGPFNQLAGVIPKLTPGFQSIAVSISGVVAGLAGFASSARGVILLNTALRGAADLVAGLGDGLTRFVDGLLSAVASARTQMAGLGTALGEIFGKVGDVLQGLANDDVGTFAKAVEGASATIRGLGTVLASVVDLAIRLGAALGGSIGVVLDNLGAAIQNAAPGLVEFASAMGGLLTAAAPLLPVLGRLASDAFSLLASAVREVTPLVNEFADWAKANPGAINTIAVAIGAVVLAFKALKAAAAVSKVIDEASTAIEKLGLKSAAANTAVGEGGLAGNMGKLGGVLKTAGLVVGLGAAAVAMDQINTAANNGQPQLAGWGGELHDIAGAAKEIATGDFSTIFSQIGQQLDQTNQKWAAGQAPIQQWFNTVKTSFQNDFLGVIGSLPGQVAGFLSTLGATIHTATAGAFDPLINTARTAIDQAVTFVSQLPGRAGGALGTLGGTLAAVASGAWAVFQGATTGAVNAVIGFVRGVPGQHAGALGGLGGTLSGIASGAWAAFRGAASGGINTVMGLVRGVPGQHSSALGGLGGTLSGIASGAWNSFLGAVRTGTNAVIGFVRGIPGQIAGAIGNLGGVLVGAGQSLMSGLLSGIRSALSSVLAFASSIAGQIAAVKGPISKDQATLIPAGQALMQGLLSGMQSGLGGVLDFASSTAGRIGAALSTAASPQLQLSASGVDVTTPDATSALMQQLVTLLQQPPVTNVEVKIGDEPLRDIVDTHITTHNRQTRRTVGAGAGTTF